MFAVRSFTMLHNGWYGYRVREYSNTLQMWLARRMFLTADIFYKIESHCLKKYGGVVRKRIDYLSFLCSCNFLYNQGDNRYSRYMTIKSDGEFCPVNVGMKPIKYAAKKCRVCGTRSGSYVMIDARELPVNTLPENTYLVDDWLYNHGVTDAYGGQYPRNNNYLHCEKDGIPKTFSYKRPLAKYGICDKCEIFSEDNYYESKYIGLIGMDEDSKRAYFLAKKIISEADKIIKKRGSSMGIGNEKS